MNDVGLLLDNPSTTAMLLALGALVAIFVTKAAKWPAYVAGIIIAVAGVVPLLQWMDASTAVLKSQWMFVTVGTVAVGLVAVAVGVWLQRRIDAQASSSDNVS